MTAFLSQDLQDHRQRYQADVVGVELVSKKLQHELWLRAMDGDKDAHDQLWLQGVKMVNKLVKRFIQLGKILPGDEMDAIQEGNLAIGEALPEWSPNRGAYSTFMWTVIRNSLTDFNTAESRGGLTGDGAEHTVHDAIEIRTPAGNEGAPKVKFITDWHGHNHDLDVDGIILALDWEALLDVWVEREALQRYYYDDWSQEEIADALGCTQPTVHRYLTSAVDKLAAAYSKTI